MFFIGLDGSRPILRFSALKRPWNEALTSVPPPPPLTPFVNDNFIEDQGMVDDLSIDMNVEYYSNIKEE